jgi:Tol biopolymer transport system component
VVFGAHVSLDNGFYTLGGYNIFIRDLELKITRRATDYNAWPPNNYYHPGISDDGRYVVYEFGQIYLSDTSTSPPTIYLVSHVPGNPTTGSNGLCEAPWISADGRTICFVSSASNQSPDDPDTQADVYVATFDGVAVSDPRLVSRASGAAGAKGNDDSWDAHLSADGRFVAFSTPSTNLAVGVSNVFLRDLTTNQTTCVTVTSDGLGPNAFAGIPRVTRGGTHVVFISGASNLTGQPMSTYQPFITLPGGGFELVGVNDAGRWPTWIRIRTTRASPASVRGSSGRRGPRTSCRGRQQRIRHFRPRPVRPLARRPGLEVRQPPLHPLAQLAHQVVGNVGRFLRDPREELVGLRPRVGGQGADDRLLLGHREVALDEWARVEIARV